MKTEYYEINFGNGSVQWTFNEQTLAIAEELLSIHQVQLPRLKEVIGKFRSGFTNATLQFSIDREEEFFLKKVSELYQITLLLTNASH